MTSRVLCTTAIEETWPAGEPVVFLGEWCRRYSRREIWEKLDGLVVPYHWDDRDKFASDYRYLAALHERLLRALAARLNEIHGVDKSLRHWRIVAGFWLGTFVQTLFDRWTTIHDAIEQFDLSGSLVIGGSGQLPVPNDSAEFTRFFIGDEWNHQLCATILREFTDIHCREIAARPMSAPSIRAVRAATRIKLALVGGWSRAIGLFGASDSAFLRNTYLSPTAEMRLNQRLNGLPQFWPPTVVPRVAVDAARRDWPLPGESATDFEACARALISRQIPTAYLEGFPQLATAAAAARWPAKPRVIWTSNDHRGDDVFMAWAADKVDRGTPLVIGQHGGHYGTGAWCFGEDHDVEIADCYFSWGWSDEREKVVPLGEFVNIAARGPATRPRDEALLVMGSLPRFTYWLYSTPVAGQLEQYFEDQFRLVDALPQSVRSALRIRLYPADFGWDQRMRWRDRHPDVKLDDGGLPMRELVERSRIYIATYNATTFLETISADVPTVIHWNPRHNELRAAAQPHFAALADAGVFHTSPESAARHVAAVWDDVDAWWRSAAVRRALAAFQSNYCARPPDLEARIEAALRATVRG